MDQNLAGKRVLVTGGSRGIGHAIADKLSQAGAAVAICGRNERDLREAVTALGGSRSGKVVGAIADVSSSESVEGLFRWTDEQLGGLDLLVNNAGIGIFKPAAELTPEEWRKVIEINLNGAFYCTREALPRFRQAGGGYLINISSLAGKNPFAGGAAYNASKFGLNGLSEAVMLDHRADRVRVTYIMPGSVDTEFGGSGTGADWKIHPQDIAQIVMDLLALPERTLVSRVEVRPSRPPRK